MDGTQSVYYTVKEIQQLLKRSRAQIDRYRRDREFPEAIVPSGTQNGGVLYLRAEVHEWLKNRPLRAL